MEPGSSSHFCDQNGMLGFVNLRKDPDKVLYECAISQHPFSQGPGTPDNYQDFLVPGTVLSAYSCPKSWFNPQTSLYKTDTVLIPV